MEAICAGRHRSSVPGGERPSVPRPTESDYAAGILGSIGLAPFGMSGSSELRVTQAKKPFVKRSNSQPILYARGFDLQQRFLAT